jgi:hypothetical protein
MASSAFPASTTSKPRRLDHIGRVHSQQQLVLDDQHNGSSGLNETHPACSLRIGIKLRILFSFPPQIFVGNCTRLGLSDVR